MSCFDVPLYFTISPSLQVLCGRGCEALLSGDLEGGHTDQGSAAGRAAHPQSGEWVISEWMD